MATTDVLAPVNSLNTPSWKTKAGPGDATPLKLSKDAFDAKKHLNMDAAPKVRTMKELGFANMGISPVAVSEPFPLFNEEAIMRMREEVLSPAVVANYSYSSNISHGHAQLRGYASKAAPFVYDAWKDPETLKVISRIAGVDLVTQLDFEIGHVNLSYKSEEAKTEELRAYHTRKRQHSDSDKEDIIVDWHCDSYPFVCVLMLSDCTNMVGGETALRTGSGEVVKVRGPQMGCAVVLQGRYIEHKALAALGATERITMVTSFRPRSTKIPDETVLTTVRGISNLTELYSQFCEYRLEIVEERIREQLKEIRAARAAGRDGLKTKCLKTFIKEQENFLAYTAKQMVDDEKVIKGTIEDGKPASKHKKRAR